MKKNESYTLPPVKQKEAIDISELKNQPPPKPKPARKPSTDSEEAPPPKPKPKFEKKKEDPLIENKDIRAARLKA
jgi:hypothetical protein